MSLSFFKKRRFFEILIPLFTWSILTFPIWLSPFHPAVVAYIIIIFDVYFFYKTFRTVIMATISYININNSKQADWLKKLQALEGNENLEHYIIIPNYKEDFAKVAKSLDNLLKQNYPLKKINIVLALEKSEGKVAVNRADSLRQKYGLLFGGFYATYHSVLPGEEKGKASNETYAAKEVSKITREKGHLPQNILVTSCDADTILDRQYLAYLSTAYLLDMDRKYHFYSAPVLLYNNYWQLNFFIRIQTAVSSIMRLAFLSEKHNFIQISVYSMSLWLLESIDYWDTDIIPEDWHVFLQAFFKHGSVVRTLPIYLLNTRDGVRGRNWQETFKNRYEQEKRWAWGVSDLPYALEMSMHTPHISAWDKFYRIIGVLETHILWPTSFFILTIGASIPAIINPYFKRTVMGYLLPKVAGGILTLTSSFVLGIAYLDFQAKHHLMKKSESKKFPLLVIQWLLFPILSPIISAFLSSIPALESHTRLLLGKKLTYKVTKKI